MLLDPPISVVADASGLADDQIRCCQYAIDPMQAFLKTPIVMQKTTAMPFHRIAIRFDGASPSAYAKYAFTVQAVVARRNG